MKPILILSALALLFLCNAFSAASAQAPANHKPPVPHALDTLQGNWAGSLQAGDAVLHLVLHISKTQDGAFKATIDSLDQVFTALK